MGSEDDEEQEEEVATTGYVVELDDERREDEEDGPATDRDSLGKEVFLDPVKLPGRLLVD